VLYVRVLVVDDEPSLRFLLRVLFEIDGHAVEEAANGKAALEQVERQRPDLIVSDVMMPVMTGRQLIQELRADTATADIPVIVVSASTNVLSVEGSDASFRKPFDQSALLAAARELVGAAA
jgi:CheY-like chemotaxis protein